MYLPGAYSAALLLMVVSMVCWGSWAHVQRLAKGGRFELLYWDFVWGLLLLAVFAGLTLGTLRPQSPESFMANLASADAGHMLPAFLGGMIFSAANLLLLAGVSMVGLAAAFPLAMGPALVIGSILNCLIAPAADPLLLFAGIALETLAIVLSVLACRQAFADARFGSKGLVLSLLSGIALGLFYPFAAMASRGPHRLGPYALTYVFGLGVLACALPFNYLLMRKPLTGPRLSISDYLQAGKFHHLWGLLSGAVWSAGALSSFVAAQFHPVGPATAYALAQGAVMVSALWGVLAWKDFSGAGGIPRRRLAAMFALFIAGLVCVALAPLR